MEQLHTLVAVAVGGTAWPSAALAATLAVAVATLVFAWFDTPREAAFIRRIRGESAPDGARGHGGASLTAATAPNAATDTDTDTDRTTTRTAGNGSADNAAPTGITGTAEALGDGADAGARSAWTTGQSHGGGSCQGGSGEDTEAFGAEAFGLVFKAAPQGQHKARQDLVAVHVSGPGYEGTALSDEAFQVPAAHCARLQDRRGPQRPRSPYPAWRWRR